MLLTYKDCCTDGRSHQNLYRYPFGRCTTGICYDTNRRGYQMLLLLHRHRLLTQCQVSTTESDTSTHHGNGHSRDDGPDNGCHDAVCYNDDDVPPTLQGVEHHLPERGNMLEFVKPWLQKQD